jgi:hypothetical protein
MAWIHGDELPQLCPVAITDSAGIDGIIIYQNQSPQTLLSPVGNRYPQS